MTAESIPTYRFGDLLALARQSWIAQMHTALAAAGHIGYRRSDAATLRLLHRGSMPVGRLGDALGITRQAARKIATGLQERDLATVLRDPRDARQLNVALTTNGKAYAQAIDIVIDQLNHALTRRVTRSQLAAADIVLRAVLTDEHTRTLSAFLPQPADRPSRTATRDPNQ